MIKTTLKAVAKHPSIVITVGVIMLIAAVLYMFIPVMAMIIGIVNMTGGDFFDSVLALIQMLVDPQNIWLILVSTAIMAILLSAVVGLLLPGYLLTVNDALLNGAGKKGLFIKGIRKYFFRFFLITIRATIFSVLLVIFLLVSSVPAIVITRLAFLSKPELMLAAVFIDIMTIGVFIVALSFLSIYIYMWYIASLTASKKPFRAGKAIADRRFWRITLGLLVFDAVFAGGLCLIYMVGSQIFRYISGWAFTTAYFTTLAVYLVQFFRDSSQLSFDKLHIGNDSKKRPRYNFYVK